MRLVLVGVQRRLMLPVVRQRIQQHAVETGRGRIVRPARGSHERKPFLAVGMLHEVAHDGGSQRAKGNLLSIGDLPQPGEQHQIVEAGHRLFDERVVVQSGR